ncbi:hypothetical protein GCM10020229_07170 [Kitasatospora albolonga]|uniref:Mu transposase C-terminal domain-containing protein n=1 Tax=Kitasatospora albolonga TaxID=68173 RepID=UPI0031EF101B
MVWKPITERGIRIDHRTYDDHWLNPLRGESSGVSAQRGRWEVHHNPHDLRQVWVRRPDGRFKAVPWIHGEYVHRPLGDDLWQHLKETVQRRGGREQHEADLAQALADLLLRVRTGEATAREQQLASRQAPLAIPHDLGTGTTAEVPAARRGVEARAGAEGARGGRGRPRRSEQDPAAGESGVGGEDWQVAAVPAGGRPGSAGPRTVSLPGAPGAGGSAGSVLADWPGEESLEDLGEDEDDEALGDAAWPDEEEGGFALYDARKEAELW